VPAVPMRVFQYRLRMRPYGGLRRMALRRYSLGFIILSLRHTVSVSVLSAWPSFLLCLWGTGCFGSPEVEHREGDEDSDAHEDAPGVL
jgi:hypothetical protein